MQRKYPINSTLSVSLESLELCKLRLSLTLYLEICYSLSRRRSITAFGVSKPRPIAVCHVKPVRKQGFCFQNMFCMACVTRLLTRVNAERFRKKALPPYELGGSGPCPKPRGLKAIAIVYRRFSNSQLTRGRFFWCPLLQGFENVFRRFCCLVLGSGVCLVRPAPRSVCVTGHHADNGMRGACLSSKNYQHNSH